MADLISSRAFRIAGPTAFAEAGITHGDVDHLMIYDAFSGSVDLQPRGFGLYAARRGRSFIAGHNTPPGGRLPAQHQWRRPLLHAFRHVRHVRTCRRACARCAAPPPPRSPAPGSRSAMASAACSPPPAPSSCRTSRRDGPSGTILKSRRVIPDPDRFVKLGKEPRQYRDDCRDTPIARPSHGWSIASSRRAAGPTPASLTERLASSALTSAA